MKDLVRDAELMGGRREIFSISFSLSFSLFHACISACVDVGVVMCVVGRGGGDVLVLLTATRV